MPVMQLSEAKSHLSGVIRDVEENGARYTIERHGVPVARIVPIASDETGAYGSLAAYANVSRRPLEDNAFRRAMEAKHADHS